LPPYHTPATFLDFCGALSRLGRADRHRRAAAALELVGLAEQAHCPNQALSRGMRQRLGIAQAIFHDPELVLLDQPADGLDLTGRREVRELVLHLRAAGKTVVLNSHRLGEVEAVCDRVAVLRAGALLRTGPLAQLTRRSNLVELMLGPGPHFRPAPAANCGIQVRRLALEALYLQSLGMVPPLPSKEEAS
jgi:ABC-2 type transport system ATP-binding protein